MGLESRLHQVKKAFDKANIGEQKISFIVVYHSGATMEQEERAIAEYKARRPDCLKNEVNYIEVPGELKRIA